MINLRRVSGGVRRLLRRLLRWRMVVVATVVLKEAACLLLAEVPVEYSSVDVQEVDQHETVDHIRELLVDVEDGHKLGIQLEVLLEQYGDSLSAILDVAYELLDILQLGADQP